MPNLQILPECYADTALVYQFIPDRPTVVHISGITNVAKEMQEAAERNNGDVRMMLCRAVAWASLNAERNNGDVRIGLVDNDKDKRVPPYLRSFNIISEQDKVLLKYKPEVNQHVIVIDKAIESFLFWNAAQVELNVADYGFARDIKAFGKALKTSAIGSNSNYLRLLTDLHTRQAPGFLTLERILNDLITT